MSAVRLGIVPKIYDQVRWSVRQQGLLRTIRVGLARVLRGRGRAPAPWVHRFDRENQVETSGLIGGRELAGGHGHDIFNKAYFGVPPSRLQNAIERWRSTDGTSDLERYAFVDLGCGKGRAVLLASEKRFRSVVGVELNAGLAETATRNLVAWQAQGRILAPAKIVRGDAVDVKFPEPPLLIYLYNSFQAPVLRRVLARLEAWAESREGLVDLLYLVPEEEAVFSEFPRFERVWSEMIPISPEDAREDTVSSAEDRCSLYRRASTKNS